MRILGIDPGSRVLGYGVVQWQKKIPYFVTCGVIRVGEYTDFSVRLKYIFEGLTEIIQTHLPEEVAIEQVFMHQNASAALKLGHARGAAMVAAVMQNKIVAEYSARQIKQAVVGYGNAEKTQVQEMVRSLLQLDRTPQADAADALAAALCHGQCRQGMMGDWAQQNYKQGRVQ